MKAFLKQNLTVRNIMICCGTLFGLTTFILSFCATTAMGNGWMDVNFKNIIWGATAEIHYDQQGVPAVISTEAKIGALALPIVGTFLSLLAGIAAIVISLLGDKLIANEKARMITVIACGALMLGGGIMNFFAGNEFVANAKKAAEAAGDYLLLEMFYGKESVTVGTSIASGVVSCVGGPLIAGSQFAPNKPLLK